MNIRPEKELRDPIHGFIPIYGQELKIIQSPVFQRLRRVKQLSFCYFIYHGAEHSRFGHAIGVMHLVDKALTKINENSEKYNSLIKISNDDIKLARLAALLHDVGHYPFSHALDKTNLIPENHEKYSIALVKNHFGTFIEKEGIDPAQVTNLIEGKSNPEKPFLTTLINSQIDTDKFDYLLRDSYYTGVKYGVYDLDRLLDSLFVTENGELVILDKGFFAAEQFVLARYLMFGQVYIHKTKRCFEGLVKKALEFLASKGKFEYPRTKDLSNADEIKNFINLDDAWILGKIQSITDSDMSHIPKAIQNREPFKKILDSEEISQKMKMKKEGEDGSSYLKAIEEDLQYQLSKGSLESIGIKTEDILFDKASYLSYKLRPYSNPMPSTEKTEDPAAILIFNEKTKLKETIEERSKIIKILGEKVNLRRTYVYGSKQDALEKYLYEKYPDLKI